MNNEKLIEAVREHEVLYDLSHSKYIDSTYEDTIWKAIGKDLQQEGQVCKTRWNNIRDNFRKSMRKNITKSGQAAHKIKKYKYQDQLEFLKPHLLERDTMSNLENDDCDHEVGHDVSEEIAKQSKEVNKSIEYEEEEPPSPPAPNEPLNPL